MTSPTHTTPGERPVRAPDPGLGGSTQAVAWLTRALVPWSETPFGAAFANAPTGMAVVAADGTYQAVNPALCRILGRSEEELIGSRPATVTHPGEQRRSESTMTRLLSGPVDTDHTRKRYSRPDGSVVDAIRTTTALRDGQGRLVGLFTQVVDVTAATDAQEALRRSEKRHRALVHHAAEVMVLLDREGRITYSSEAAQRVLGYRPEDLVGRSAVDLLSTDDRSRGERRLGEHMTRALPPGAGAFPYQVRRADGSWIWAEVVATNLLDDPDVGAVVVNVRDVTERYDHQRELAAREARFRALLSNAWDIITLHDSEGRYVYCSPAVTAQLGYVPEELVGTHPGWLIHPEDVAEVSDQLRRLIDKRAETAQLEYRVRHADGSWRWMESVGYSRLDDPAIAGVVITSRDVTQRRMAEKRVERRASQQRAVASLSGEALRDEDLPSLFDRAVRLAAGVLGVEHAALVRPVSPEEVEVVARCGMPIADVPGSGGRRAPASGLGGRAVVTRASVRVGGEDGAAELRRTSPALGAAGMASGAAVPIAAAEGEEAFGALAAYSRRANAFTDDDLAFLEAVANVVAAAVDRHAAHDKLRRRALHDGLTGLPNREQLLQRLRGAVGRLALRAGAVSVLFVDTDEFKNINDSLGHAAGDTVVAAVAERIVSVLRRTDTVARFGGDEFVVVCEDTPEEAASALAGRIRQALAEPVHCSDRAVHVTASVGIATTSDPDTSVDDLLARADTAMYVAKRSGKDRAVVFDDPMRREATERLERTTSLRRALTAGELRVFYQPVVTSDDGTVIGAEALVRWEHPQEGLLGPDRFVGFAEESGLIVPLGLWVLEEACRQSARWRAEGRPCGVAVNVSGRQLAEAGFVEAVERVLAETGARAADLSLELTESAVMGDLVRAAAVISDLKAVGVKIGMDDFGTGYSSLSYLASLPFDFVKIDRSFVARVTDDERAAALLAAIAGLCRTLDLPAIAEGVETEQQRRMLASLGIQRAQGFLFGRPAPA